MQAIETDHAERAQDASKIPQQVRVIVVEDEPCRRPVPREKVPQRVDEPAPGEQVETTSSEDTTTAWPIVNGR